MEKDFQEPFFSSHYSFIGYIFGGRSQRDAYLVCVDTLIPTQLNQL